MLDPLRALRAGDRGPRPLTLIKHLIPAVIYAANTRNIIECAHRSNLLRSRRGLVNVVLGGECHANEVVNGLVGLFSRVFEAEVTAERRGITFVHSKSCGYGEC